LIILAIFVQFLFTIYYFFSYRIFAKIDV